jgi:hypothetical protein
VKMSGQSPRSKDDVVVIARVSRGEGQPSSAPKTSWSFRVPSEPCSTAST